MKRFQLTSAFQPPLTGKLLRSLVILLLSLAYFSGLMAVPFHPDESTNLFMAADFEALFHHPASLVYQPDQPVDLRTHYRLVDPPLTRYLVGFSQAILGLSPLPADWDWSASWQQNAARGALPSHALLFSGRLVAIILFPFSLLLIFWLGRKIHSPAAGWGALLLFASSSLILLHTRRAMAEPGLVFFSLLSLWIILRHPGQSWLSAIPLALAFNAKYSAIPLVLAAGVNILWRARAQTWRERLENLGFFILIFALLTFALNPFLWGDPLRAIPAALQERQSLVAGQVAALTAIRPDLALPGWWDRMQVNLVQLYFAPLAIQDIGNYSLELRAMTTHYLANPLHLLWRGMAAGAILLALTSAGLLLSLLQSLRNPQRRRENLLLLVAGLAQWIGLSALLSLPFQRYVLPLVPFVCLWSGVTLAQLFFVIQRLLTKKAAP